jgi:glyoxylase-like metal-dependent hydrolase (beta-lactamase superfamily II)
MKAIDFSSKHDILIRNEDGSLRPMDEPYFESKLIAPGTWQILSDGDYSYLIEGDKEAMVIDSGYGCGNIREYCQTLTKKPVRNIANTHDHFDHTANNCYFKCAYMSAETKKKATIPFPSFAGIDFPRDYPIKVIGDGYKFQLGNRELEVFEIPDHATGSLAYLDKRERILFSGDEITPMGKRLNGSVANFERLLQKLAARRSEFDRLCTGAGPCEASWVDKYLANARYILAGHEGEVVKEMPPRPAVPAEANLPGRVIYNRRFPHPCDLPPGIDSIPEYLRVMNYADCQIMYDARNIRD